MEFPMAIMVCPKGFTFERVKHCKSLLKENEIPLKGKPSYFKATREPSYFRPMESPSKMLFQKNSQVARRLTILEADSVVLIFFFIKMIWKIFDIGILYVTQFVIIRAHLKQYKCEYKTLSLG
jgi:hypothetical protein